MKTLLIDNYDSFTYNLYHLLAKVNGKEPMVVRNDECGWDRLEALGFDQVVISPGPGRPESAADFGISGEAILRSNLPILGVCLGHQGIAHLFGGKVIHAREPFHGRTSCVYHEGKDLFEGLPSPISVVRYHSLVVDPDLPGHLEVQARTEDGTVMALRHRHLPIWGIQFHPESFDSDYGEEIIANFKKLSERFHGTRGAASRGALNGTKLPVLPTRNSKVNLFMTIGVLPYSIDGEAFIEKRLRHKEPAVWLDSSRFMEGLSRFSYLADTSGPLSEVLRYSSSLNELEVEHAGRIERRRTSILEYLEIRLREFTLLFPDETLPFDFTGGYAGYFGYEMAAKRGGGGEAGGALTDSGPHPDAWWLFVDRLIVIDHLESKTYLVALSKLNQMHLAEIWIEEARNSLQRQVPSDPFSRLRNIREEPVQFRMNHGTERYLGLIDKALGAIRDGESYELCLTNSIVTEENLGPFDIYRHLRRINPAPFAALIVDGERAVMSSSPERFVKLDRTGRMQARPIKGTRPRSDDCALDHEIMLELERSEKDRAENRMIVDLLRNDFGRVSKIDSVKVPASMQVESFASVHQLVSTVTAEIGPGKTAIDVLRAAFPGGSMTGAPKIRTMEILGSLEKVPRGVYSGALGWIGLRNDMDLSIVIRTIVQSGRHLSIGAGGAIVAQSKPADEVEEMLLKAKAPMSAIALAATGDKDSYVLD